MRGRFMVAVAALAAGACSVDRAFPCTEAVDPDGTRTVTCPDGTQVVLENGAPGTGGTDGRSCTILDLGGGVSRLTCNDGTDVTITQGGVGGPVSSGDIAGVATLFGASDHSGITVSVDGMAIMTTTDNLGGYTLSAVPAGTHDVRFEATGRSAKVVSGILVLPGTFQLFPQVISIGARVSKGDNDAVQDQRRSNDGSLIAFIDNYDSAQQSGDVILFDTTTGLRNFIAAGGRDPEFSPDGSWMTYIRNYDPVPQWGEMVLYEVATPSETVLSATADWAEFTDDTAFLLVVSDRDDAGAQNQTLTVVDLSDLSSTSLGTISENFRLSGDGAWLHYSRNADMAGTGALTLREMATGVETTVRTGFLRSASAGFDATSTWMYFLDNFAGATGDLVVMDLATQTERVIDTAVNRGDYYFSPAGNAVAYIRAGVMSGVDLTNPVSMPILIGGDTTCCPRWTSDGRFIVVNTNASTTDDLVSHEVAVGTTPIATDIWTYRVDSARSLALAYENWSTTMDFTLIDLTGVAVNAAVAQGRVPINATFAPDGSSLLYYHGNALYYWDVSASMETLLASNSQVNGHEYSPSGGHLKFVEDAYGAFNSGTLNLLDTSTMMVTEVVDRTYAWTSFTGEGAHLLYLDNWDALTRLGDLWAYRVSDGTRVGIDSGVNNTLWTLETAAAYWKAWPAGDEMADNGWHWVDLTP